MPLKDATAILGISIQLYEKSRQSYAQQQQLQVPQAWVGTATAATTAPASGTTRSPISNNSSTVVNYTESRPLAGNNRSTVRSGQSNMMRGRGSKGRRTRKHRKQRGGLNERFIVHIRSINCTTCEEVAKFILDVNGNTYDYDMFKATEAAESLPAPIAFSDRLEKLLVRETETYPNEQIEKTSTEVTEDFAPIHERSAKTMERLLKVKTAIDTKPEGAAPSNYRAFLLASRFDQQDDLSTMFCNDKWSKQRTTNSSVAYSLLQSLYDDLPGGGTDSRSSAECAEMVAQFMGAKVVQNYTPLGATAPTRFDQIAFLQTPSAALAPFCTKVEQGVRKTKNPQHKSLLMAAHRQLRDLYDSHIKACVELIRKMLRFAPVTGYRDKPVIQLSPVFEKTNGGSQVALDGFIQEGRKLLAEHFLATEKVYQGTLRKLAQNMAGNYVEAPKLKNEIAVLNDALSK